MNRKIKFRIPIALHIYSSLILVTLFTVFVIGLSSHMIIQTIISKECDDRIKNAVNSCQNFAEAFRTSIDTSEYDDPDTVRKNLLNAIVSSTDLSNDASIVLFTGTPDSPEGMKILEQAVADGHKFEFPVSWGVDLASEHERFLVEEHFKRPVIMVDYPREIKAFYMKQNADGRTVQGTDVLFPQIGEIIGGSVREENYDKLMTRINELNIPMKDMWWYLDTRRYGSCPHAGFGLGFERLMLFVTGMANIRDVIPFPRTPKTAEF